MDKIWKYRGIEYPFDITEEACYSLVNRGLEELRVSIDGDGNTGFINSCCESISRFFDTVFGVGAGATICGREKSAEAHIAAYISFISFLCTQVDQFAWLRTALEVAV